MFTITVVSVFGLIVFSSGVMAGMFLVLVISMRRAPRGALSKTAGARPGAVSRRVLTRAVTRPRFDSEEAGR